MVRAALLRDDLRLALRRLRHQPGFAATAVLTLALGLGANIAIFSLLHAVLLRSLPVDRPGELYRLGDTNDCCVNSGLQGRYSLFSFRLFEHLREATAGDFVELAGFQAATGTVAVRRGAAPAESLRGQYVSANYFQMFGVTPAAGRLLAPDDDRPEAPPAVVLSHREWARRFGGDPALVGGSVFVNGRPMTVVGVAAPAFFGDAIRPNPPGIWIPLGQESALRGAASLLEREDQNWLYAIGRLRPDVRPEQTAVRATAALRLWLEAQPFLSEQDRSQLAQQHVAVVPAGGGVPLMKADFGQSLTLLLVTSGLVLLIAAANLANLLLARSDRGQAAIRAALGAPVGRLLRQGLTEGVLLALAGGFVGVWLAVAGRRVLVALAFPGALVEHVPIDTLPSASAWLFALALAVGTGALFSAGPAWAMARTPPREALSGAGRSGRARSFVPRRSLVIVQVALSFVLLAGAGLLAASLGNLERQELGFAPEARTVVHIDPPALAGQRPRLARLYAEMRERLLGLPGVQEVSYALYSPMEGNNWSSRVSIAGRRADPASPDVASWNRVGPRYFETTGTRLLAGRLMADREIEGGARVAVVNDAFRRRFFEHEEPVGGRLGIGDAGHAGDYEIVGVVADVRYTAPRQPVRPMIFLPAFQGVEYADPTAANVQARSMLLRALVVQAAVGTGALEPAIRRALAEVDPDLNVVRVLPLADQVSANFHVERLTARLTTLYGLLALTLAAVGLYGVTAFGVSRRTREIAVRMAIGAGRRRVVRAVVAGSVGHTAVGLLLGIPAAVVAGRSLASQLYGVAGQDPVILGVAAAVLLATAAIAALLPALRAAAIDPAQALRSE